MQTTYRKKCANRNRHSSENLFSLLTLVCSLLIFICLKFIFKIVNKAANKSFCMHFINTHLILSKLVLYILCSRLEYFKLSLPYLFVYLALCVHFSYLFKLSCFAVASFPITNQKFIRTSQRNVCSLRCCLNNIKSRTKEHP